MEELATRRTFLGGATAALVPWGATAALRLPFSAPAAAESKPFQKVQISRLRSSFKAQGFAPLDAFISQKSGSLTQQLQKALASDLSELQVPILLGTNNEYVLEERLDFPHGSGLINPGGSRLIAPAGAFDNTKSDGKHKNAVVLAGMAGASGLRFERIVIAFQGRKGSAVGAIYAVACPDLMISDTELSGFNNAAMISIQSCPNFKLVRPHGRDGVLHTDTTDPLGGQLTHIQIDGDERLDDRGQRIGSTGTIDHPRTFRLRPTDEVLFNIGDQTDAITIGGNNAVVTIVEPIADCVAEPIDCFGSGLRVVGGRHTNNANFGLKLVHGAQNAKIDGLTIGNAGLAGLLIQQGPTEPRPSSGHDVRMAIANTGLLELAAVTASGVTVPPYRGLAREAPTAAQKSKHVTTPQEVAPRHIYDLLMLDASSRYPVENCKVDLTVTRTSLASTPLRCETIGHGNVVISFNPDGTMTNKKNRLRNVHLVDRG